VVPGPVFVLWAAEYLGGPGTRVENKKRLGNPDRGVII
jgi:hypothetical protein